MKKGFLVVNAYLKSAKFDEIYHCLIKAAESKECKLLLITNAEVLLEDKKREDIDFVLFWDKDIKAAKYLEELGYKVFNNSRAIEICDDKSRTYLELISEDIVMPKTYISPLTYGLGTEEEFLNNAVEKLGVPFVIKENFGSFGAQVYLAHTFDEAKEIVDSFEGRGYIVQKYIESSAGRDVRIHIVGDKYVTAMERKNASDFRANVTNGGKMEKYTPTKEQIDMALKVCRKLNLDFAGVDIMFGEEDTPVFCEVNSNAHFKNILDCTGVNVAPYIMEHILGNIE